MHVGVDDICFQFRLPLKQAFRMFRLGRSGFLWKVPGV